MGRPARNATPVRERLVQAGAKVFIERGIYQVTMGDVAKVAGCARSTAHAYFSTMDDLLAAILHRELIDIDKTVPTPTPDSDFRDDLVRFADNYHKFYKKRKFLLYALPEVARRKGLRKILLDEQAGTIAKIKVLFLHHREENEWTPLLKEYGMQDFWDRTSTVFLGGIFARMVFALVGLTSDDFRAEEYVDLFLNGYGIHHPDDG